LRGHVALELATCLRRFDHCVLAPAFPFQGRITRGGRQLARVADQWREIGTDLQSELKRHGLAVQIHDAETNADLDSIVAAGRRLPGRVLWCGTGGLASALAGHGPVPRPALPGPVLALIGSNHPVSLAQAGAVPVALQSAIVRCELPLGVNPSRARSHIRNTFTAYLQRTRRPGTLYVSGGETLRDLCDALGVTHLEVDGEIVPGVPTSVMRGGDWDGQRLVSKSGAFGDTGFLADLLGETQ